MMKPILSRQPRPACRDLLALLLLAGGLLWLRGSGAGQRLGAAALDGGVSAGLRLLRAEDGFLTLS